MPRARRLHGRRTERQGERSWCPKSMRRAFFLCADQRIDGAQFCGDHVEFLEWMGMGTLGSVSRLTKRQLKAVAAEGTRLYGLLHPTVAERFYRIPYWHNQTRIGQIDLPTK